MPVERHPWFPVSTCGHACLGPRAERRAADAVVTGGRLCRLAAIAGWIVATPIADGTMARLRRRPRRALRARAAGPLLAALGIRVVVDDRRRDPRATGLIVANHISFLDVLALALVSPAPVVAKSDVVDMPVVAGLARRFGVIAVDRGTLRGLPAAVGEVSARLATGSSVIVFPEGQPSAAGPAVRSGPRSSRRRSTPGCRCSRFAYGSSGPTGVPRRPRASSATTHRSTPCAGCCGPAD
ncbi:1-acyl-sn-glycerol-3-phosphate acyltransferase [Gordonia sp. CNJ-863]|uniref:lysophospholipid acyltransferase family protein n=1 Tax=Gordonia sp. CNJ-863 TaxID=1904963 RepID=UPI000B0C5BE0|nr:lysophospholipid acyltransferase family protein [Gordonia sp. CNJ-863]